MDRSPVTFKRWPMAILIGVLAGAATALALWWNGGPGLWLEQASYDAYYNVLGLGSSPVLDSEVVIIYIDLDSHRSLLLDPSRPWPRELHARLLERLRRAGARGVVFDVLFDSEREDHAADTELETAIRQHGRVWLAGELGVFSHQLAQASHAERGSHPVPPADKFLKAAHGWGLSEVHVDQDFTSRRHFSGKQDATEALPSLTYAAAGPESPATSHRPYEASRWLRYYGPPFSIPNISFHRALDSTASQDDFFRDRIVLIGGRVTPGTLEQRRDEYRSPFRSWGARDQFMPGVEVHATQLRNLLRRDYLWRPPADLETLILSLTAAFIAGGLTLLRSLPSGITGTGLLIGTGVCASWFARSTGLWFPWLVLTVIPIPLGVLGGAFLTDTLTWLRARARFKEQKLRDDARIHEQAALLDKARDGILVIGLESQLLYANPGVASLYECPTQELAPHIQELFDFRTKSLSEAKSIAITTGEWQGELTQTTRAGNTRLVESRWTLIRDAHNRPHSLLIINTDVTEKRALEREAHRTQRMETIGELAGGMAHDLNNALAPVLMGVQLLKREETDEQTLRILSLIENNTHRGADMVRQVLFFARGHDGASETLDLRGQIGEIERLVRETFPKSIKVHVQIAGDLWSIQGQSTQIHQVLLNLCVNARDAMNNAGSLSLAADNVSLSATQAAANPGAVPGDYVCLLVSDTGSGIPAEVLPRIFDPFFTTKPEGEGTGLGLSTCQRIVKAHGGFIRVDSAPGEGTTFEVYLPKRRSSVQEVRATSSTPPPRGHGETLLVIDDEDALRQVMRRSLEDHGYHVLVAASASEGLQHIRTPGQRIDLVLCDLQMPDMNGDAVATEARRIRPGLRVLLMTGAAPTRDPNSATKDIPYLIKPFDLDSALHRIADALAKNS